MENLMHWAWGMAALDLYPRKNATLIQNKNVVAVVFEMATIRNFAQSFKPIG
jgi:hypothetical protein